MTQKLIGLPPIANKNARVLILGSFPSEISLEKKEYYANPRNKFWDIIETLFSISRNDDYESRCEQLKDHGIAVWDVLEKCCRNGSLDGNIREPIPNDFSTFYKNHPQIKTVLFNGAAAEKQYKKSGAPTENLYKKLAPAFPLITYKLLSTSPANASYTLAEKIKCWQAVADALKP